MSHKTFLNKALFQIQLSQSFACSFLECMWILVFPFIVFFFLFMQYPKFCIKRGGWKHSYWLQCIYCNDFVLLTLMLMPHFTRWFIIEMFKILILIFFCYTHLSFHFRRHWFINWGHNGFSLCLLCMVFKASTLELLYTCIIWTHRDGLFFQEIFVHMKKVSHIHLGQHEGE